jgi:hypothetical protein
VSARIEWTIAQLDPQPGDAVLEIGYGHGVAASCVLARQPSCSYTGIDRSRTMHAAASRRCRAEITAGRATFLVGDVIDATLGDRRFDRAFAARVRDTADQRALRVDHTQSWVERVVDGVDGCGFGSVRTITCELDDVVVMGVVAQAR